MATISPVPSWLHLPPDAPVAAPTLTLAALLPIADLTWPNFERLILRLARGEADVVGARLYGSPGQAQEGIDLYARLRDTMSYRVYQAKKVEEFGPAAIRGAIEEFLIGSWADRATGFILCTSESLRSTQKVEAIEEQRRLLGQKSITLGIWDVEEISEMLRSQPQVVHDFFGPPWVEVFCGSLALASLTSSGRRLSPSEVTDYRRRLRGLYRNVFAENDPGLTLPGQGRLLELHDRYVVPDVIDRRDSGSPLTSFLVDDSSADGEQPEFASQEPDDSYTSEYNRYEQRHRRIRRRKLVRRQQGQRIAAESFLVSNPLAKLVIVGGPGTGKSALLRFLALDLLSEEPRLTTLTAEWGDRLPLWLPFGGWVEQTARANKAVSLSDMIRQWLIQLDEPDLWRLVEHVLNDRRLLLLVDGLDEWTDEGSARIALTQLNVFSSQRNVPVLLTSRPHGFSRIAADLPAWGVCSLASLSKGQQVELARKWFAAWLADDLSTHMEEAVGQGDTGQTAHKMARRFVDELSLQPALAELSAVPLLLSVLLFLRFQHAALPDDRFRAYEELAHHLISVWPRHRRAAALVRAVPASELRDDDREQAFAYLAYHMHHQVGGGLIDQTQARLLLEKFLSDETTGLGYPADEANRLSRELIDVGEFVSGILVKRSPRDIGFYHRSLQEFLAARHIASLSPDSQLALVQSHGADPAWREVLLGLLWLTHSQTSVKDMIEVLDGLQNISPLPGQHHLAELLCEAAVGPFACPANLARSLTSRALDLIQRSWWTPHRMNLLRTTLTGVRNPRVRPMILKRLGTYFPNRVRSRTNLLVAVTTWPDRDLALSLLLESLLFAEDGGGQVTAALLIADKWKEAAEAKAHLLSLATEPLGPRTRAACLLALIRAHGYPAEIKDILLWSGNESSPELKFLQSEMALVTGEREPAVTDQVLEALSYSGKVDFSWRDVVAASVIQHLAGDDQTREACLARVRRGNPMMRDRPLIDDSDLAWKILLEAFPGDAKVADAIGAELQDTTPLLNFYGTDLIAKNFGDNKALQEAIDAWLATVPEHREPLVASLALVTKSGTAKRAVLTGLSTSFPFWSARALLDGWGMGDPEIREQLTGLAMGPDKRAQTLAHLIPRIIDDPDTSYNRLLNLLRNPDVYRTDFVIRGLHDLGRIAGNEEVVKAVMDRIADADEDRDEAMIGQTIIDAADLPGVRDLAIAQFKNRKGAHSAAAQAFGQDSEIKQHTQNFLGTLPRPLRIVIPEFVREEGLGDRELVTLCAAYRWDDDAEVATEGARAYYRGLRRLGAPHELDLSHLRKDIVAYGPTHYEERQAAAAGLIELGRAEIMTQVYETRGEPRPTRVPLIGVWGANQSLLALLVDEWPALKTIFPEGVIQQFAGWHGTSSTADSEALWSAIAPYADENADVTQELLRYLEEGDVSTGHPELLLFLARHRPRTRMLRDQCIRALMQPLENWAREPQLWEVAADILTLHFGDDLSLWTEFESALERGDRKYGLIVGLARAQPDSGALKRLMKGPHQFVENLPDSVYLRLACAVWEGSDIKDYILDKLQLITARAGEAFRWLYRPLVERMNRDRDLRAMLSTLARSHPNLSFRGTLLSVLSEVPGGVAESELRTLLIAETSGAEQRHQISTLSYDMRSGLVRPLSHILLQVVGRVQT